MKRIFFIAALIASLSFCASAQVKDLKSQYNLNEDTVTNAATKYLTLATSNTLGYYYKVVTVQFWATKISGTVGGTAQLQGSLDRTNWYNVGSAVTLTDVAGQITAFKVSDSGDPYYRVAVTGTGTMAVKISAKLLARNAP